MDMRYFDEQMWGLFDPALVELRERAELERFKKMGVYTYAPREEAIHDPRGKVVKAKRVRVNKRVAN